MNKYIPLIFIGLTIVGLGLLAYHLTNETSNWKNYLSSILIIIANIGMFIAVKKSDKWTEKNNKND